MNKKEIKAYQKAVYGNPNWVDGRINRSEYFLRVVLLNFILVVFGSLSFFVAGI